MDCLGVSKQELGLNGRGLFVHAVWGLGGMPGMVCRVLLGVQAVGLY